MAFEFPDDDTPSPASVTFAKKSAPAKAAAPADTRPWINFKAGAVVPAAVLLVAAIGAGTYLATRKPAPELCSPNSAAPIALECGLYYTEMSWKAQANKA